MKIGRNLQSIVISTVLFTGLLVFLFVLVLPSREKMLADKKELDAKSKEVENVSKTIVSGMNQFKKEFDDLEKEYEALSKRLPLKSSFSEILNQISKQTENLPIQVMSNNKLDPKKDDDLKILRVPIVIDIVTDYRTLGDYLRSLEDISIALTIQRLVISKDERNLAPPKLRVDIELETYISLVE